MIRNHNNIKNKNIIIFFVCPVTKKFGENDREKCKNMPKD